MIRRHSRNPDYDPRFSLVDALQQRGLFATTGSTDTSPVVVRQRVGDYVEQLHSTATLAREHMSAQEARASTTRSSEPYGRGRATASSS